MYSPGGPSTETTEKINQTDEQLQEEMRKLFGVLPDGTLKNSKGLAQAMKAMTTLHREARRAVFEQEDRAKKEKREARAELREMTIFVKDAIKDNPNVTWVTISTELKSQFGEEVFDKNNTQLRAIFNKGTLEVASIQQQTNIGPIIKSLDSQARTISHIPSAVDRQNEINYHLDNKIKPRLIEMGYTESAANSLIIDRLRVELEGKVDLIVDENRSVNSTEVKAQEVTRKEREANWGKFVIKSKFFGKAALIGMGGGFLGASGGLGYLLAGSGIGLSAMALHESVTGKSLERKKEIVALNESGDEALKDYRRHLNSRFDQGAVSYDNIIASIRELLEEQHGSSKLDLQKVLKQVQVYRGVISNPTQQPI